MSLYHFTDTAHLPWIVHSRELRPGRNTVGGFPAPAFLWASANSHTDDSAAMHRGEGYRSGLVRHIRFTLPRDQFIPWREVPSRYTAWTWGEVQRMEQGAPHLQTDPANWFVRAEPLSLTKVIAADWRSYRNNRWAPLPQPVDLFAEHWPVLVVRVGDHCFASQQIEGPHGRQAYGILEANMRVFA